MHSAVCPICGTRVEYDFVAVAGHVWCPACQKLFSPPVVTEPEPQKAEQIDRNNHRDGKAG
jgi:uncharacterized Zn finger protein (UPF0148 family)